MSRHTLISNSFSSLTELAGNVLNSEHCSYLDNGTYVKKNALGYVKNWLHIILLSYTMVILNNTRGYVVLYKIRKLVQI